jgi:hypothetical protein
MFILSSHPSSIDALCSLPPSFLESAASFPGMENTVLTGSSDGLVRAVQVLPTRLIGVVADHGELPVERLAVGGGIGALSLADESKDGDEGEKVGKSKDKGKGKGKAGSDDEEEDEDEDDEDAGKGAGRWWVASAGHDEVLRLTDLEAFFRDPSTGEEERDAPEDGGSDSDDGGGDDDGEEAEAEAEEEAEKHNDEGEEQPEADSDGDDSDAPTAGKRKRKPEKDPLVVRRKKGKNEVDVDGAFFDGL